MDKGQDGRVGEADRATAAEPVVSALRDGIPHAVEGMKALSIRAPWWWAILHAGKDIENRDWPTKFRGRVLIHASKWWNLGDVTDDAAFVRDTYRAAGGVPHDTGLTFRGMRDLGGHIVGSVEIVDCVPRSESPWFFGRYGFVLRDPIAFAKPIPCKGALGFFDPAKAMETREGRDAEQARGDSLTARSQSDLPTSSNSSRETGE